MEFTILTAIAILIIEFLARRPIKTRPLLTAMEFEKLKEQERNSWADEYID